MIEQGRVDGQNATLCYIDDQFQPVDRADATLLVAILEDGRKLFLKVPPLAQATSSVSDYNKKHRPKGEGGGGQFAPGSGAGYVAAQQTALEQRQAQTSAYRREQQQKLAERQAQTSRGSMTPQQQAEARRKGAKEERQAKLQRQKETSGVNVAYKPANETAAERLQRRKETQGVEVTPPARSEGREISAEEQATGKRPVAEERLRNELGLTLHEFDRLMALPPKDRDRQIAEIRKANRTKDSNPNHLPGGGPHGGEFAPKTGGSVLKLGGGAKQDLKKRIEAAAAQVNSELFANPMAERQVGFANEDQTKVVMMEVEPSFDSLYVKWLSAHPQKGGMGTEGMNYLKKVAAKHDVPLTLTPWKTGQLGERKLTRIFNKMGFIAGKGGLMWWYPPKKTKDFNPSHEPAGSSKGGQFAKKHGGTQSGIEAYYKRAEQQQAALKHTGAEPTHFTYDDFAKADMIEDLDKFDKIEDEFLEVWNNTIRMSPEDFKKAMLGTIRNDIKVDFDRKTGSLNWGGKMLDDKGSEMGTYAASMVPAKKQGKIDYLEFEPGKQGQGIGKDIVRQTVDKFRDFGMERVELHANIDVGGYAWAKYGFVPFENSWSRNAMPGDANLRTLIGDRAARLYMQNDITGDEMNGLNKLVKSDDPKALWAISDSRVGKALLLDMNWYGAIYLNDDETMRRFNAYVARKH